MKNTGKRKAEVRNLTRGSKKVGLEVAADDVQLDEAIKEFRRGVKSAGDTYHRNAATWRDLFMKRSIGHASGYLTTNRLQA